MNRNRASMSSTGCRGKGRGCRSVALACSSFIHALIHSSFCTGFFLFVFLFFFFKPMGHSVVVLPSGSFFGKTDPEQMGKGLHERLGPLERSLPKPRDIRKLPRGHLCGGDGAAFPCRPYLDQSLVWGHPASHQVRSPLIPPDQWEQEILC